ncbi:hypothetical protein [Mucilaginibacter auburnensis]|uniref:Uncharacterized protein n=1 Tax=Mucilaginibacter auburnensis TaxID=1457233 RepID=A0A2H9VRA2_9SPHI|nr:hypothetical protein [Mucilaginibacter auburnensis]PJJ83344.1 hypothetical protein CLV57_0324 [Mucilaginibacter auburnensis]
MVEKVKSALVFIGTAILNVALFIVLQIYAQFAHFFLFGEGALSDKFIVWVSLSFALIQVAILILLFRKRFLVKTGPLLGMNIIIVAVLFIYYVLL